jgi:hypothetical protein
VLYRIESDIERLLAREGNRWGCPVAGLGPTYWQSRFPKLLAAGRKTGLLQKLLQKSLLSGLKGTS